LFFFLIWNNIFFLKVQSIFLEAPWSEIEWTKMLGIYSQASGIVKKYIIEVWERHFLGNGISWRFAVVAAKIEHHPAKILGQLMLKLLDKTNMIPVINFSLELFTKVKLAERVNLSVEDSVLGASASIYVFLSLAFLILNSYFLSWSIFSIHCGSEYQITSKLCYELEKTRK